MAIGQKTGVQRELLRLEYHHEGPCSTFQKNDKVSSLLRCECKTLQCPLCISSTQKRITARIFFPFSEKLPAFGWENSGSEAVKGHFLPVQDFRGIDTLSDKVKLS